MAEVGVWEVVIRYIHHMTARLRDCMSTATGPGVTWLQGLLIQVFVRSGISYSTPHSPSRCSPNIAREFRVFSLGIYWFFLEKTCPFGFFKCDHLVTEDPFRLSVHRLRSVDHPLNW